LSFLKEELTLTVFAEFRLSYVPLIAPSTSDDRIKKLIGIADSFAYVVSKVFIPPLALPSQLTNFSLFLPQMGVTGSSTTVSDQLGPLLSRIRKIAPQSKTSLPLAVGFGVSAKTHFDEVGKLAEGVVIGSKLIQIINENLGSEVDKVREFCQQVSGGQGIRSLAPRVEEVDLQSVASSLSTGKLTSPSVDGVIEPTTYPSTTYFGNFGGQYVPEALYEALTELEECHSSAMKDPEFLKEWENEWEYINRPSILYEAKRLTEKVGGAKIWMKREDLNHTGSHKLNNAIGQVSRLILPYLCIRNEVLTYFRVDFIGETVGKEEDHRRDRSGSTWSRNSDGLRQIWNGVCGLYGSRRCEEARFERFQDQDVGRQSHSRG
jgi:tryptophan synthase